MNTNIKAKIPILAKLVPAFFVTAICISILSVNVVARVAPKLATEAFTEFLGLLDSYPFWFNIVTP
jgi:hypothetical protein